MRITRVEFSVETRGHRNTQDFTQPFEINKLLEDVTPVSKFLRDLADGGPIASLRIQIASADENGPRPTFRSSLALPIDRERMVTVLSDTKTTIRDMLTLAAAFATPPAPPAPAN